MCRNCLPFRSTWVHRRLLLGFMLLARSLSFYVVFCRSLFVLLSLFSFGHCVVCPSFYSFWLPHWYLQTFLLKLFWHGYNVFLTIKDFYSRCHYILFKQNKTCMLYLRSGVVIFVSSLEDVNTICSPGLSGNGRFFEAQYLVSIPKKLTVKLSTRSSKYVGWFYGV